MIVRKKKSTKKAPRRAAKEKSFVAPLTVVTLFDMSQVQRFHALELLVIEYEKWANQKTAGLARDLKAGDRSHLLEWFIAGADVNNRYNYVAEMLTQARMASILPDEKIMALRERIRQARDQFYTRLYRYYDKTFTTVRALAGAIWQEYNPLMQEYFEAIHHSLVGLTSTGIETILLKKREVENFHTSNMWLGKYSHGESEYTISELQRHEKEARKAIRHFPHIAELFAAYADDLMLSNTEREHMNDDLGTKLPLVGK